MRTNLVLGLPSERRRDGQDACRDEPEQREDHTREPAIDVERDLTGVATGEDSRVTGPRNLVCDVTSRVRSADHQHGSRLELRRAAVVRGVELSDRRIELVREFGDRGVLVLEDTRGDDHVVRMEPGTAGRDDVRIPVSLEPLHGDPRPHGELEPLRVGLEVVGHLEGGRPRVGRRRESHTREPVDAGGGIQPQ